MLIGSNGEKQGLVAFSVALESARVASLDLVQVSPSDATLADSKATEKATNPCFSPFDPISITSLARIFSLIGVIFFF